MTDSHIYSYNYVAPTSIPGAGYGIFAGRDYQQGDTVETCIFLEVELTHPFPKTLQNYVFGNHQQNSDKVLMMLGNGPLFNHSDTPNLIYGPNGQNRQVVFKATQKIAKDSELFISYGKDWFQVIQRR